MSQLRSDPYAQFSDSKIPRCFHPPIPLFSAPPGILHTSLSRHLDSWFMAVRSPCRSLSYNGCYLLMATALFAFFVSLIILLVLLHVCPHCER